MTYREQAIRRLSPRAARGLIGALIPALLIVAASSASAATASAPSAVSYDSALGLIAGSVLFCLCAHAVYVNLKVLAAKPRAETALMAAIVVGLGLVKCALLLVLPGVAVDVNTYQAWASKLQLLGPRHAYEPGYFLDYPPGYLYVLWAMGWLAAHLHLAGQGLRLLVETPPLVADALLGAVLFARVRQRGECAAAFGAMLIFALNPGLLYDSVAWGQSDSVPTLLMLLALLAALDGRYVSCWALSAAAALVKPQGLILMPLLAWWTLLQAPARQWVKSAAAALGVALLLIAPFQFDHQADWIFSLYRSTASYYHETSVNAFNLMALVGGLREPDSGTLAGVSYFVWGLALTAGWYVFAAAVVWRERRARGLMLAAAIVFFGSFMLLARMHERYLYPALVLLIPLALEDDVAMAVEGILTATFLFNLYQTAQMLENVTFFRPREPSAMVAAAVNVVALALLAYRATEIAWPTARGRLIRRVRSALGDTELSAPPPASTPAPNNGILQVPSSEDVVGSETAHPAAGPTALKYWVVGGAKAWPGLAFTGASLRWLTRDTLILAALLALGALSRFWRLGHPDSIVFDEVHFVTQARHYLHAEYFLDPHPPLAKLLIALGIGLFGDHPMSWRLANAALGTLLVALTYLLGRRLSTNRLAAALAAGAVLCDGMFLVDSRVGVIDIVYLTCAGWSYLLLFRFVGSASPIDARRALAWLGVSLGLCLSGKLYVPAATFVLVVGFVMLQLYGPDAERRAGRKLLERRAAGALLLLCGASATVYLAVFLPHYWLGWWRGLGDLFAYYGGVVWYERSVYAATHPYAAPWWSWPLMLRPIAYWQNFPSRGDVAVVWGGGNPVLWWGALSAIAISAVKFGREGGLSRAFLLAGYVLYLAIWVPIGRTLFLYHYMPAVYLGFLALGGSLAECWEGRAHAWEHALLMVPIGVACLLGLKPGVGVLAVAALCAIYAAARQMGERREGKAVCVMFVAAALLLFFYYFPLWIGSPLPRAAYYRRMWLQGPGLGNWI